MTAEQSIKEGDLEQAKALLQEQVRKEPAVAKHRVFLFQLLSILGEWERALTQLGVLADMDASTLPMVRTYQEALRCEVFRAEVFAGRRSPLVLGEPEPWLALVIEAVRARAEGRLEQARSLRDRAFEEALAVSGSVDGQPFEWIADADPGLGPILEVIVHGRYYWVPFQRIRVLHVEAPADLRDFVWIPANLEWQNGGQAVGLIPARYVGSERSTNPAVKLARHTEWEEIGRDEVRGIGQRMLATNRTELPLLDVRELRLDLPQSTDVPPSAPSG